MSSTLGRTREKPRERPRRTATRHVALVLVCECERPLAGGLDVPLAGLTELTLGRGSARRLDHHEGTATLRVPDEWMSSRHARLVPRGAHFALEDLGSKNGT